MMKTLPVLVALMAVRVNAQSVSYRTAHYLCKGSMYNTPALGAGTDAVPGDQVSDSVCDPNNGLYNPDTNANHLPSPHLKAFNAEFGSTLKYCHQYGEAPPYVRQAASTRTFARPAHSSQGTYILFRVKT